MITALALQALVSCSPASQHPPQRSVAPLRLPLESTVISLDPAEAGDAVSRRVTAQIFDTLVDWAPDADDALRLRPEILRALPETSADGLRLTLTLRDGPDARRFAADTCLGGQARAVRASDVAASLRRIDPARHPAHALLAGRIASIDGTDGILADDAAHTVTLHLTRPQPELPAILASPMLAIVPPECVAFYDGRDAEHPPFARHPVGSGPYVLDHAQTELPRTVALTRNLDQPPTPHPEPGLGCPELPGASPIVLSHFLDPEPALRSFQAGELAALAPGQAQFAEVVKDGQVIADAVPAGTRLLRFPVLATTLLVFNMRDPEIGRALDPTLDDRHRTLRQVVAAAFDTVRYQRVIRNDAWATPRARVVPRGLGGAHDDEPLHPHAPPRTDRAAVLAMLATQPATGPLTLRYWTGPTEAERQEAAILRDALLPFAIDLRITHRERYLDEVLGGRSDAQLYSLRFDADYLDPATFLAAFTCTAPDNFSGHCDPAYDAAYAAFAVTPPGLQRDRLAADLDALLGAAVPVRPIDQPEAWYLVQPWLQGVQRHPLAGLRLELLCPQR